MLRQFLQSTRPPYEDLHKRFRVNSCHGLSKGSLSSFIVDISTELGDLIPEESCKLVVQSFVTSRLDYSSGLLYGITKSSVSILQSVQSSAARIVTKTAPKEHIQVLKELHSLPVI